MRCLGQTLACILLLHWSILLGQQHILLKFENVPCYTEHIADLLRQQTFS